MSNWYKTNVQYYCFLISLNKIYTTYRDLHTSIILNNVLKLLLIIQRIPIDELVFCYIHKQLHPSHVRVTDLDSSDLSRLYPNERYRSERYASIYVIQ